MIDAPLVHVLDPLTDPRWDDLVARHPRASVFHTTAWLRALEQTYGYEPFALTTTQDGPLGNGLVCCRVKTWAARRLVSLPFSDHCEPLVEEPGDLAAMAGWLSREARSGGWRSLELRPRALAPAGLPPRARYCLHTLDLRQAADAVFRGFHPSSTQRAIRRAGREGVTYAAGRSDADLAEFFRLLRLTRRRHGLPPQPFAWFRHLVDSLGGAVTLHLARHRGVAIAAVMTLTFKSTVVYKYGGSDHAFHPLGGMPFVFWQAIQAAIADGADVMDLGRSDLDQPGLIAFKDHLGAARSELTYSGWPEPRGAASPARTLSRAVRKLVPLLPDTVLDWTGRLLYRHLG